MKNLIAIITGVLIILFLGFLVIQNCECDKSSCSVGNTETEETSTTEEGAVCADDCQKACCLGCHATEGDAACLADHSCCFHHEHEGETDSLFEAIEEAGGMEEQAEDIEEE